MAEEPGMKSRHGDAKCPFCDAVALPWFMYVDDQPDWVYHVWMHHIGNGPCWCGNLKHNGLSSFRFHIYEAGGLIIHVNDYLMGVRNASVD